MARFGNNFSSWTFQVDELVSINKMRAASAAKLESLLPSFALKILLITNKSHACNFLFVCWRSTGLFGIQKKNSCIRYFWCRFIRAFPITTEKTLKQSTMLNIFCCFIERSFMNRFITAARFSLQPTVGLSTSSGGSFDCFASN